MTCGARFSGEARRKAGPACRPAGPARKKGTPMNTQTMLKKALPALPIAVFFLLGAKSLNVTPDSSVWLVGDSTLHPFTAKTSQVQLTDSVDPQAGADVFTAV